MNAAALILLTTGFQQPQPQLFQPGIFSTAQYELAPTFTPDGETAFWTMSTPSYGRMHVILTSSNLDGKWSTPEVAPFSGRWNDADPFVAPDGKRVYFISNRADSGDVPKTDYDIFYVERTDQGWGEAQRMPAPVNTPASELYVTLDSSGNLFTVATREGGKGQGDLYRVPFADGKFGESENLGVLNSPQHDTTPCVSADGKLLVFASGRTGGLGDYDLYYSRLSDAGWSEPVSLGAGINTATREFCPLLSPDGKFLYFSSDRSFAEGPRTARLGYSDLMSKLGGAGNTLGDVYRIEVSAFLK